MNKFFHREYFSDRIWHWVTRGHKLKICYVRHTIKYMKDIFQYEDQLKGVVVNSFLMN